MATYQTHGLYRLKTFTCKGCGEVKQSRKLEPTYCSVRCMTARGAWSWPATHPTLERVYGVTK